jgi:thymidine kinase
MISADFYYFCEDFSHKGNNLFSSRMLIEKNIPSRLGWIEVICGSMFSGKTEELIRRLKRARIAKQRIEIFKPEMDTRYDVEQVVSHDANAILSTPVQSASQILLYSHDVDVIGIDEAQFLDDELSSVCNTLANSGIRVIVAGLDMDYLGKPFGPIPSVLATAEYVTKFHAICMKCGDLANYTHRLVTNDKLVVLGEKDLYEPLCRKCYLEEKKNTATL